MKKKDILIYILFVIVITLISSIKQITMDGIWGYGFSYNIASGLIPYQDFNMIIGPLYNLFFSLPIKLFGNYLIIFTIAHSLIYAYILLLLYKKIGKNSIFVFMSFFLIQTPIGYNTFCSFLVIAILLLENNKLKYKDEIIGLLIGIILMTKHNIGIMLGLIYLFENRKNIGKLRYIFIPVLITLIYLKVNNTIFEYIDFCYLGMGNFISNLTTDIISVPIFLSIIYFLVKEYIKNKKMEILYLLAFQIIVFPILDQGHLIPALLPVVVYILLEKKKKNQFLIKYFILIGWIIEMFTLSTTTTIMIKNNFLFLQGCPKNLPIYLEKYSEYMDSKKDRDIYLFNMNAYMIRIYRNENPTHFDLINKGNLGSNEEKYLKLLDRNCRKKKCLFILSNRDYEERKSANQTSELFKNYVEKNAKYLETMPSKDKVYISETS